MMHLYGEPVTFGIHPEDVGPFLERLQWRIEDLADCDELERRHSNGRSLYPALYTVDARSL